jgi:hypothetical protein
MNTPNRSTNQRQQHHTGYDPTFVQAFEYLYSLLRRLTSNSMIAILLGKAVKTIRVQMIQTSIRIWLHAQLRVGSELSAMEPLLGKLKAVAIICMCPFERTAVLQEGGAGTWKWMELGRAQRYDIGRRAVL